MIDLDSKPIGMHDFESNPSIASPHVEFLMGTKSMEEFRNGHALGFPHTLLLVPSTSGGSYMWPKTFYIQFAFIVV